MEIKLKSKKYPGLCAIIDNEDYDLIKKYKWRVYKTTTKNKDKYYASADYYGHGKKTTITMHRLIMNYPKKPFVVDHINGDGLDNRRSNLRIVTQYENILNSPRVDSDKLKRSNKRGVTARLDLELYHALHNKSIEIKKPISWIIVEALHNLLDKKNIDVIKLLDEFPTPPVFEDEYPSWELNQSYFKKRYIKWTMDVKKRMKEKYIKLFRQNGNGLKTVHNEIFKPYLLGDGKGECDLCGKIGKITMIGMRVEKDKDVINEGFGWVCDECYSKLTQWTIKPKFILPK